MLFVSLCDYYWKWFCRTEERSVKNGLLWCQMHEAQPWRDQLIISWWAWHVDGSEATDSLVNASYQLLGSPWSPCPELSSGPCRPVMLQSMAASKHFQNLGCQCLPLSYLTLSKAHCLRWTSDRVHTLGGISPICCGIFVWPKKPSKFWPIFIKIEIR